MPREFGSIAVTQDGELILLTSIDDGDFDRCLLLRRDRGNPLPVGRIRCFDPVRVICHIDDLLRMAEKSGMDLKTPPEKPLSALTALERLERLERLAAK